MRHLTMQALMYFHLEAIITQQLGRPLTPAEVSKLEEYCAIQPERKEPGIENNLTGHEERKAV